MGYSSWGLKELDTTEQPSKMETQTWRKDLWTQGRGEEGEGGMYGEKHEAYTLSYIK